VTPYCSDEVDSLDCNGNSSLFAVIPGFGSCREKYMTIAPSQSATAAVPFHPRDVFVTQGDMIFKIDVSGGTITSRCLRRSGGAAHRTTTDLRSTMLAHLALT
jgi:hypothetical protein